MENSDRKLHILKECDKKSPLLGSQVWNLFNFINLKILYCAVPKVACSNWKFTFLVLEGVEKDKLPKTLDDVHHGHYPKHYPRLREHGNTTERLLNKYPKIIFVREPLERLLSAYIDKIVNERNHLWKNQVREYFNHTKRDIPFYEFCKFVIDTSENDKIDEHWRPQHTQCSPCFVHYDYIGKYETLSRDADVIIKELFPHSNVTFPRKSLNYKKENDSRLLSYYQQLPPGTIRKLWEVFSDDYRLFNYTYPSLLEQEAEKAYLAPHP